MSYKEMHPLFWRTRRTIARLPLSFQLCAAAVCGALGMLTIQLLWFKLAGTSTSHLMARTSMSYTPREKDTLMHRPKKLVVVAAGLPRTGSTWVYNVLRILMRIRDPNNVAGWYADLIAIWKNHKTHKYDDMKISWLEAYASLNTSLLLKMHGPGPFKLFSQGAPIGSVADLAVITHRDLRSEVRSWVYQNWNSSIHAGNIEKTPFVDPARWVRVAGHILHQRKMTLASIGDGRYLDIRYEDWTGKGLDVQVAIIEQMANELDWDFTPEELRSAAVEAGRLEAPANGAALMYNPANALHPGHTRVDAADSAFNVALGNGFRAIEEDPECREFLQNKHYM